MLPLPFLYLLSLFPPALALLTNLLTTLPNSQTIFHQIIHHELNKQILYLYADASQSEKSRSLIRKFEQLSNLYENQIIFILCDDHYSYQCSEINYQILRVEWKEEPVVVYYGLDCKKYLYDRRGFDGGEFGRFREDVLANRVQEYLLSSVPPISNDDVVKIVVGLTFREFIHNSNKEILLKIYAPWGGHCKHLHPRFRNAAQLLKNNDKIIFAQIDGTSNETPGVKVRGFPTIVFFPANKSKAYQLYEGPRSAQAIVQWLRDKTQFPQNFPPEQEL